VNLAPRGDGFFEGFTQLLLTVCARNVRDDARFSQTSVGWLLRELSKAEPEQVASFVERNREVMSKEALKAATTHLR
jgi:3-methyladenine DNA glycosylase AlkD